MTQVNGAVLLIPLFLIRYGLLALLDRGALERAAHYPPMAGAERAMALVYQAATVAIVAYSFMLGVRATSWSLAVGLGVYGLGTLLMLASAVNFAKPNSGGVCTGGLYRFSRNPMYVAYFVYFVGCALLTRSPVLFALVCVFQISAHFVILSEERWCARHLGEQYLRYMKKVRRYV